MSKANDKSDIPFVILIFNYYLNSMKKIPSFTEEEAQQIWTAQCL